MKTTITFKYDQYFIDRTSRVGSILEESMDSDRILGAVSSTEESATEPTNDNDVDVFGGFSEVFPSDDTPTINDFS